MYMSIFGGEKWKDFHPGGFWGVRKWRILCFISANSPSGVGGRFFRARVNSFELPGMRKGGLKRLDDPLWADAFTSNNVNRGYINRNEKYINSAGVPDLLALTGRFRSSSCGVSCCSESQERARAAYLGQICVR